MKCFEYLLNGSDVIAVLPTGFGKSLLFQLLPNFLPLKADKNVVIVVCPLNSIFEDQLKVLEKRRFTADVLQLASDDREGIVSLLNAEDNDVDVSKLKRPSKNLLCGDVQLVFAHQESLLSEERRELMKGQVFQGNVAACVVDETHCVW